MNDRHLLDRAMLRYSAAGWEIISQSEIGFQVCHRHVVSTGNIVMLVLLPMVLGVIAGLFSLAWASALFSLAITFAGMLALHHFSVKPQLIYVSAEQLRNPIPATITHDAKGNSICSVCGQFARSNAEICPKCRAVFAKAG